MDIPPVRYARSGKVSVAYQVTGEGNPIDMVFAPGTVSHLSVDWERPFSRSRIERFSRFCRFIRFDKRGTGMSDRMAKVATLEERTDDIRLERSCSPCGKPPLNPGTWLSTGSKPSRGS